ncbi:DUF3857 domain-containing protein [Altererythrobacter indicus]|uniref:DUF3857 domain-containing protein n=1 Tax=Altericroceibacterium indicum TaxID=374177 RepID=A0A845AER0_9SPHN|nr:DUF3857 domain-containing protein [Altericroceibacterium indicum]MXP27036.1 DUF3857 domain-containing protein [Altericroceibacterium indicum]
MRFLGASFIALACCSVPAWAGDDVLYGDAPEWVDSFDISSITPQSNVPLVLLDIQQRIENNQLVTYSDRAFKLDSPEAVTSAGTVSTLWLPDKGDLTVNRLDILRDGKTIHVLDALAADNKERFTVLRREQQLEQRSIDGLLTATMTVPDLRVGDILRVTTSTTLKDATLDGNVQATQPLFADPQKAGYAHYSLSWPEGEQVSWRAGPFVDGVEESSKNGYHYASIALPLPKREDMPSDAPMRYLRAPLFQATTYKDWKDVSSSFADLYSTEGKLAAAQGLEAEVNRIKAASADPLQRAALALQLVQDDISYLANGMNGGNYVPQSPAQTWAKRYGDCKAKTVLLLTLLHAMDIEAEAALVSSTIGDAVPELLPMPADFDHVLVRAMIGGREYWLDGTAAGTRITDIDGVPPFFNALPLRAEGADLIALPERPLAQPNVFSKITLDESAGFDLPVIFTIDANFIGPIAAQLRPLVLQGTDENIDKFSQTFSDEMFGNAVISERKLSYDVKTGVLTASIKGVTSNRWSFKRGKAQQTFDNFDISDVRFAPDRARSLWRDIPVSFRVSPIHSEILTTIALPSQQGDYTLVGKPDIAANVINMDLTRTATLNDKELTIQTNRGEFPKEIQPGNISAEKAKTARLDAKTLRLEAVPKGERVWELSSKDLTARTATLREIYAAAIAKDPKETAPLRSRALFRQTIRDYEGTYEDLTAQLEIEPTAELYLWRAWIDRALEDDDQAIADTREAFALEPTPDHAWEEARVLKLAGDYDSALKVIANYEGQIEDDIEFTTERADILGAQGKTEEGLEIINSELVEKPNNPYLLEISCWHRGKWNVGLDDVLSVCTQAIENSSSVSSAMDGRALAYFRLAENESAIEDLNNALEIEPDRQGARYLRGIVRLANGDKGGQKDVDQALRDYPHLQRDYARYDLGVK